MRLTVLFKEFFESEKGGGVLLILCTIISLLIGKLIISGTLPAFLAFEIWRIES